MFVHKNYVKYQVDGIDIYKIINKQDVDEDTCTGK